MVQRVILSDKIYGISTEQRKSDLVRRYDKYLKELIQGFSSTKVSIRKLREVDNRLEIFIDGPEEKFVKNLLNAEIGIIRDFENISAGDIIKGNMVDVGKFGFGIFVDCAIKEPQVDVLIPLYKLRKQLVNNKKVSVQELITTYDFIENFPIYVKLIEINKNEKKIKGEIASESLTIFEKILDEDIEGLIMIGETKAQFKNALIRKGHLQDIISLKRYGFLEHLVLFKQNTNALGIIAEIGNSLENCKFSALIPKRIKKLLE